MTNFTWGTSTPNQSWATTTEQSWGLPIYIVLELRSIATNDVLTYPILKSSNISLYPERYDKYVLSIPSTTTGQYTYIAYESTTTSATNKINVLETGLAYIQMSEQSFVSATNPITYAEPSSGNTFDNTFDLTFN
jgi:hypothetical protein